MIWDKKARKCVNETKIAGKVRSVSVSPDNKTVAAATFEHTVVIYSAEDIITKGRAAQALKTIDSGNEEIAVLKFSPNGQFLAAGSHDNFIRIYSTATYALHGTLSGHTSYISALDWSDDSLFIQSICGAYELLYWNVESCKQDSNSKSFADTKWHTQSCKLGWSVRAIWGADKTICYNDGTDVNMVDANFNLGLLAVGDDMSTVSLFAFPTVLSTVSAKQRVKCHCSHVTNVRFTSDNEHLISTGGADLTVIQHKIAQGKS